MKLGEKSTAALLFNLSVSNSASVFYVYPFIYDYIKSYNYEYIQGKYIHFGIVIGVIYFSLNNFLFLVAFFYS